MAANIVIALIQVGCSIAGLIYSIKVIREKKLGFGITFLVLFSLLLLLYLIAFIVGFIIGVSMAVNDYTLTGNVIGLLN